MASSHRIQAVRRFLVVVFYFACAGIVLMALVVVGSFLLNPFAGFDRNEEFHDLPGASAKRRLGDAWPSAVDPASVRSVNHATHSSRDSYSCWYRVELTKEAAKEWMDHIHAEQERDSKASLHRLDAGLEGVHRSIGGPPPMRWQTGETPAWWSPPGIEFRATEIMTWYIGYDSGFGRATYSGFDESTDTLWVYDYARQHDQLWSPGNVPQGVQIHVTAKN
jgi:hypothetical protein